MQEAAKTTYRALKLRDYGRIDMRLTSDGDIYVIEANPNPQLGYGEDFAESAERAGVSYQQLLQRILMTGLQWQAMINECEAHCCAVCNGYLFGSSTEIFGNRRLDFARHLEDVPLVLL